MSSNNHQIAKNAFYLYIRMFILMIVSLYTSRINLQSLGIDNYGVYNVVAGFVVMFGALTGALGNAISRFIQVELGRNDSEKLKQVFATSATIQIIVGVFMALLIEILGLWFIYFKIQIPPDSFDAAIWLLQFSIISFVINLLYVPYYSCIIAHEKMSAFAVISLLEAILKLLIAFAVAYSPINKLIVFGGLLMLNQLFIQFLYIGYCKRHFTECRLSLHIDKNLTKEMAGFVGWNMFAHGASVLSVQGVNMVMNVFFGVVVNAARAIETQVSNAVQQFVSSFTTALIPPITKSYAAGDKQAAYNLVYKGDRFSFFLTLLLALPIMLESNAILTLWLKNPPTYSSVFVFWTLAASLARVLGGNTIFALIMADGNIKKFQIAIAVLGLLPLPLSWLSFCLGFPVISAYIIYFITHCTLIFVRLYYARSVTGMSFFGYCRNVLVRALLVTLCSLPIPLLLKHIISEIDYSFILIILFTLVSTALSIAFVGLNKTERKVLLLAVKSHVLK